MFSTEQEEFYENEKMLAGVLAVAMCCGMYAVPSAVYAEEEEQYHIYTYVTGGDDLLLLAGDTEDVYLYSYVEETGDDVSLTVTDVTVTEGEAVEAYLADDSDNTISVTAVANGSAVVDVEYCVPEEYAEYEDENEGHLKIQVKVSPVVGGFSISRGSDATYILKGQTIPYYLEDLWFEGEYDPSRLQYSWDLFSYDEDGNIVPALAMNWDPEDPTNCTVTCDYEPEYGCYLACSIYYNNIEIAHSETCLEYASSYYELIVTGFDNDMDIGESCTVKPQVKYYSEEKPDGTVVPASSYTLNYYGDECEIVDNGDGTYTITSQNPQYCDAEFYTSVDDEVVGRRLYCEHHDERDEYYYRLSGADRYQTAAATAEELFCIMLGNEDAGQGEDGRFFENFVIASADNFPDALAGCPLAYQLKAPILLAGKNEKKNQVTYDTIEFYGSEDSTIYILGGTAAVPQIVEDNLKADGHTVIRLAGDTRYDTNVKIMEAMDAGNAIAVVCGTNYADALSISGVAGVNSMPIVLANMKTGLTQAQIDAIKNNNVEKIYIIGGKAAVTEQTESQIAGEFPDADIVRYAGDNRYATSTVIAVYFNMYESEDVVVAYGRNFPDGLTGGVLAAALNAPLLLTDGGPVSMQWDNDIYLWQSNHRFMYVMGGENAVSTTTARIFAETLMENVEEAGE